MYAYYIGTLTIKHTTIALKPIRARKREKEIVDKRGYHIHIILIIIFTIFELGSFSTIKQRG